MSNVAMNLVATMMQNKFSNSYSSSVNGATQESFTKVLSNSKKNSYNESQDQKMTNDSFSHNQDTLGKTLDKVEGHEIAKKQDNSESLNHNNDVKETTSHDKVTQLDNKEVNNVKENEVIKDVKDVKDVKLVDEGKTDKLTEVEAELVADIANQLNVDPVEIENLLSELQLTVEDLYDMNNLQMFMTQALGVSSPMELLVTDGAAEQIQEVMKTLETAVTANPELAKEVSNMNSEQGDQVNTEDSEFVKLMETIQNESTNSNQSQQQEGGEDKAAMDSSKAVQSANVETSQNASGFEGALSQVVTQKTETIIMNGSIQTIQTEVTAKDVFDQIVTGMKVQVSEAKSNITLQLQPHNLGKIALNLTTENGSVTGHFVAETEAVKEVIEANLSLLKNQLQSQGIEISEIKITVGSSTSFFAGQEEKENTSKQNFKSKNNKNMKIGNINDILADKLSEEVLENETEGIGENSSIELHA